MDLNLGESGVLERFILPEALWNSPTVYQTPLAFIGKGVAALFDRYCNRKFKRNAAHVDTFTAERDHYFLSAAPVESITTVHIKTDHTEGWVLESDAFINLHEASGRCSFGSQRGADTTLIKVTYAGGYWYDATETQDDTMPAEATLLPSDLHMAWLMQCQHQWGARDKIGTALSSPVGEADKQGELDLVPAVKRILDSYIRYQMT